MSSFFHTIFISFPSSNSSHIHTSIFCPPTLGTRRKSSVYCTCCPITFTHRRLGLYSATPTQSLAVGKRLRLVLQSTAVVAKACSPTFAKMAKICVRPQIIISTYRINIGKASLIAGNSAQFILHSISSRIVCLVFLTQYMFHIRLSKLIFFQFPIPSTSNFFYALSLQPKSFQCHVFSTPVSLILQPFRILSFQRPVTSITNFFIPHVFHFIVITAFLLRLLPRRFFSLPILYFL